MHFAFRTVWSAAALAAFTTVPALAQQSVDETDSAELTSTASLSLNHSSLPPIGIERGGDDLWRLDASVGFEISRFDISFRDDGLSRSQMIGLFGTYADEDTYSDATQSGISIFTASDFTMHLPSEPASYDDDGSLPSLRLEFDLTREINAPSSDEWGLRLGGGLGISIGHGSASGRSNPGYLSETEWLNGDQVRYREVFFDREVDFDLTAVRLDLGPVIELQAPHTPGDWVFSVDGRAGFSAIFAHGDLDSSYSSVHQGSDFLAEPYASGSFSDSGFEFIPALHAMAGVNLRKENFFLSLQGGVIAPLDDATWSAGGHSATIFGDAQPVGMLTVGWTF